MILGAGVGEVPIGGAIEDHERLLAYANLSATGGALFFIMEIEYRNVSADTLHIQRASDWGYASSATDAQGVLDYPPIMLTPPPLDRRLPLVPGNYSAGATWGTVTLDNYQGDLDVLVDGGTIEGRQVIMWLGEKDYDRDRGIFTYPGKSELSRVFDGTAGVATRGESSIKIPLRDLTLLLEIPWQDNTYAGTGGAEGTSDLEGRFKPRVRGEVKNVTPVLIDPTNLVYQWTDGAGTLQEVYERGFATFTDAGDYASYSALIGASLSLGEYATAEAVGMFRLATEPDGEITCDAQGDFPSAGYKSLLADIAYYILTEDAGIDPGKLNRSSFTGLASSYAYAGGIYDSGGSARQTQEIVAEVLSGLGAKLIPDQNGRLKPYRLEAPGTVSVSTTYTDSKIVKIEEVAPPSEIFPPVWRWRVGYNRNYTVQTSDLSPSITTTRRQFLAEEYDQVQWSDSSVKDDYRNYNDPEVVGTPLSSSTDAQALADHLGSLWGVARRVFRVTLWAPLGTHDIGEELNITYPLGPFRNTGRCVVIGEEARPSDGAVTTYRVLI